MSRACHVCGKTQGNGHNVSHANNKSNRVFKPNLQSVSVVENGSKKRVLVCTRCIRSNKVTKAL